MKRPTEIFLSYAHEDEKLVEQVLRQLEVFDRQKTMCRWHDRQIPPGAEWQAQIDVRLQRSDVVLLFISPDFFASDYCYNVEMVEAMKRHTAGTAEVIPIILRPCLWDRAPFGRLQALPTDGKPVTTWINQDEACMTVAEGVMRVVHGLSSRTEGNGSAINDTGRLPDQTGSDGAHEREFIVPVVADGESLSSVSGLQCPSPLCRSVDLDLGDAVEVLLLQADAEGWLVQGEVQMEYCIHGRCRTCGRILEVTRRQISVQFPDLTCNECGRRALLKYRVLELKKVAGGYQFSVEIRCSGCQGKKKVTKVLAGMLRMVGIAVGVEGISVTMDRRASNT